PATHCRVLRKTLSPTGSIARLSKKLRLTLHVNVDLVMLSPRPSLASHRGNTSMKSMNSTVGASMAGALALFAGSVAVATSAQADTFGTVYTINQDHCSSGCGGGTFGTVSVSIVDNGNGTSTFTYDVDLAGPTVVFHDAQGGQGTFPNLTDQNPAFQFSLKG